eukprot:c7958_g1_i1.p1 GENE.c7958_g1_i1~~c7958_g1_i1.p1  ORF type:complete len:220 (+),score=29.87 c7958_g1_i1:22-660(+)
MSSNISNLHPLMSDHDSESSVDVDSENSEQSSTQAITLSTLFKLIKEERKQRDKEHQELKGLLQTMDANVKILYVLPLFVANDCFAFVLNNFVVCLWFCRMAKQANSVIARLDTITPVPRSDGTTPAVDFPVSLSQLLVGGSETVPDQRSGRADWSIAKSKALLEAYNEQFSDAESDSEAKKEIKSRRLRLRVARVLGITTSQLNFAQIAME